MNKQKNPTLKAKRAEGSLKPKGKSKYAQKRALQKKGKYFPTSPFAEIVEY